MRVIIAPDKFKGSVSAVAAAEALRDGMLQSRRLNVKCIPMADGGDGTLDAVIAAGFQRVAVPAHGPTLQPLSTAYAARGPMAIVELSDVCGLARLPHGQLRPADSSSVGLGEVVRSALDGGFRQIVLCVGGSASTDGGSGMLAALGARLVTHSGRPIRPGAEGLNELAEVDLTGLDARLRESTVTLAADVNSPLFGEQGAAQLYGPQKGADAELVARMEFGLRRWSLLLAEARGRPPEWAAAMAAQPSAGAAGGVGFAALAGLDANTVSGIDLILDLTGFASQLRRAQLVVTGEGSLDEQTLHGKAPTGVARAAARAGVKVVAVAGRCRLTAEQVKSAGFAAVYTLEELEPDLTRSMAKAPALLRAIGRRLALEQATRSRAPRLVIPPDAWPYSF
jgi:glycerate 2-kinase